MRVLTALLVAALISSVGRASGETASAMPAGAIQKGSLANQQLIRDAMLGVSGKAGTLGCAKIDSYQPYVLAMPQGSPGSRTWRERWVVMCQGHEYPVDIRFNESGMGAADYTIE